MITTRRQEFKDKVYHMVTQFWYQHGHLVVKEDKVLKTKPTTTVTHQPPPSYSLLSDSYDPRREVRISNEPSSTQSLSHQVKQTHHETRYTRRPRSELCQSVGVTNTVNR